MSKIFKLFFLAVVMLGVAGFTQIAVAQDGNMATTQGAVVADPAPDQMQEGASAYAQPVKKKNVITAFFDKFYTSLVGGGAEPDPSMTMVAPFETDTQPLALAEREEGPLPVNNAALDQPHRSAASLAETVQQLVAESLSFTAQDYQPHLERLRRSFTPQAIIEYNAWATGSGTLQALQDNRLQLNGFVSDKPFLLNEGVVAGRYRWLYEVPVMVSFVPLGMTSYRAEQGTDTRSLIVMLQIGRSAESLLDDQIFIESWSVKNNTRRN